jgi:hypothetical protein
MKIKLLVCLCLLAGLLLSAGKEEFRDAQGRLQGTAREKNGKIEYRDAQGRLQGTKRDR